MKTTLKLATMALVSTIPFTLSQTFSDCDPTKKSDCPAKPGLNQAEYFVDFTQGASAASQWTTTSNKIEYGPDGAIFSIKALGEGPTTQSNFYIFGGYVEVVMKAAPGAGIVSSLVLQSDDLDEMDWEMIGSDTAQVQSNYFGKGNTTTYDRGAFHKVAGPQTQFVTYAVDWTMEKTTWFINGAPVRTLNFADAVGGKNYPQTPCNIRLGNWVAGTPGNSAGTIEWAGGLADMSKAPFNMYVKSVKVINYAPAASYKYGDMSGSWQSIQKLGTAATSTSPGVSNNNGTGPGAVPFQSVGASVAISASQAAASAAVSGPTAGANTVTINTDGTSGNGVPARPTGVPCNGTLAQGQAVPTGLKTYTIFPQGQGQGQGQGQSQAAAATGASFSNGTVGGIVGQGFGPGNSTNPTVTVNVGGVSPTGAASGASNFSASQGAAGNPQTFGLGSTPSNGAFPAQQTTNAAPLSQAGSVLSLGAALAFAVLLA